MRAFVDRINGEYVTLLFGDDESVLVTIPLAWLKVKISEGQVLKFNVSIDIESTDAGKLEVQKLMDSLGDEP